MFVVSIESGSHHSFDFLKCSIIYLAHPSLLDESYINLRSALDFPSASWTLVTSFVAICSIKPECSSRPQGVYQVAPNEPSLQESMLPYLALEDS